MNLNTKKQQQQNVQCNPTSDKKEDKRNTNLFDKPTNENISNDDKDKIYQNNDNKKTGIIIATVAGLGIVIIIVLIVILLKGGGQDTQEYNDQQFVEHQTNTEEEPTEITDTPEYTQQYNTEQDEYDNPNNNTHAPNGEKEVGFQDFSGDTNRNAGNKLTDPNKVLKDVYGLSTRVDYDVSSIDTITDFVNYEKHRGTWGGGVELYWLDATYKNTPYIIQVPFKFYKELDDIGIVPVKMEVLRIPPSTNGDANERTIISYMTLDEETLENLLSGR